MTSKYAISRLAALALCFILTCEVRAVVIASDSASDPAYAAEAGGAWKGLNPTSNENPAGTDNGGFGFLPWSFGGGYHDDFASPYGKLNHFIDGVDFTASTFDALGGPAFGLANAGSPTENMTANATRPFASTLTVGDTFSVDLDTAKVVDFYDAAGLPGFAYPFVIVTFNDAAGLKTFAMSAGASVLYGPDNGYYNWSYEGPDGPDADTEPDGHPIGAGNLTPNDTIDGTSLSLKIIGPDSAHVVFDGIGFDIDLIEGLPKSVTFTLYANQAGDGMGNPTGEHEFYFDNLKIESASVGLSGDFDSDGDVDGRDFLKWQRGGSPSPLSATDLAAWQGGYGSPLAAISAVPEPASLGLCGIATISWLGLTSRKSIR